HAVRFQPKGKFELIGRKSFKIVGAVKTGGTVEIGSPGGLQVVDVGAAGDVLGALEHHVLEQMGETGASRGLVRGADVIPNVYSHQRQAVIFRENHFEAVIELIALELQLGNFQRGEFGGGSLRLEWSEGNQQGNGDAGKKADDGFHGENYLRIGA